MNRDMENKTPPVLNMRQAVKVLLATGVPVFLSVLLQEIYNLTDMYIVSVFLGSKAFAALGAATTIINLFLFVIKSYCEKISARFAHFVGRHEPYSVRQDLFMGILSGLCITFMMGLICWLALPYLIRIMDTPAELENYIFSYMHVLIPGLGFTFLFNMISALLGGAGDDHRSTVYLLWSLVFNLLLDVLFVGFFHIGVAGAAWATVISQAFSCLFCFHDLFSRYPQFRLSKKDITWDFHEFFRLFKFGRNAFFSKLASYAGKLEIQSLVNALGTASMAIYTAGMKVEDIMGSLGEGITHSVSTLTARFYGRQDEKNAQMIFKTGLCAAVMVSVIIGLFLYFGADLLMDVLFPKDKADLASVGPGFIRILGMSFGLYILNCVFTGYFYGLGNTKISFTAAIIQVIVWIVYSLAYSSTHNLQVIARGWGLSYFISLFFQAGCYIIFGSKLRKKALHTS